jgi:hypothetical protein
MNARQTRETPRWPQQDRVARGGREFADPRGVERTQAATSDTRAMELALQCMIDSYRAFFGLG